MTHAYFSEIAQLIAAVLGILFSMMMLWVAVEDSNNRALTGQNGALSRIAKNNIRSELSRLLIGMVFVVIGTASIFLPPPWSFVDMVAIDTAIDTMASLEDLKYRQELQISISRYGIIGATVILMLESLMSMLNRKVWIFKPSKKVIQGRLMSGDPKVVASAKAHQLADDAGVVAAQSVKVAHDAEEAAEVVSEAVRISDNTKDTQ